MLQLGPGKEYGDISIPFKEEPSLPYAVAK